MPRAEDRIGPYTLIKKLGQGSFGVVWLAERRGKFLTTQVALKIPMDDEPDLVAIQNEAQSWLKVIGHPNVLPVLDADEYDGQIVIVSEYAPDGTLGDWMKAHGGKAPTTDAAVAMVCGILSGLEHLHGRKMIHRDLKPGNVLLQGDTPRLTDFGVSRVLRTVGSTNVAGTPAYMAPEMFDGLYSEQTDLWAAGVVLYRMLAGTLPFSQQGWGALYAAIKEDDPAPLPLEVAEPVRSVVVRALRKNPQERFASATEMRAALLSLKTMDAQVAVRESPHLTAPSVPSQRSAARTPLPLFDLQMPGGEALVLPAAQETQAAPVPQPPRDADRGQQPGPPSGADTGPRVARWPFSRNIPAMRGNEIDGADVAWIAAGEFWMGDADHTDNPRRRVSVDGFWLYRHPVTVAMFKRFCAATGQSLPEPPPWGWLDDHPMVNVHWQDAINYCKWARVSLPTEVQWEKAARGIDGRRFPWGGFWDPNRCCCSRSNQGDAGSTTAVRTFSNGASPFGVMHMSGNVWEWCHEMVDANSMHGDPGSAPKRVLRGGSWEGNMPGDFRTSFRQRQFPSYMYYTIGFRCVMDGDAP